MEMVRSAGYVLLLAVPLTLAWFHAVTGTASGPAVYLLPLGAAALALGAIGLWRAFLMDRWALIALLVFAAVALNVILRVRDYGDTGLDPQGAIKLLTWLLLLGVAVANLHRFAALLADPVVALFGAFSVVALFSALWSPVPTYTAACALGLLAYLCFACLLAGEFGERTIVLALLRGLAAFLVATWVAALTVPDFAYLAPHAGEGPYRLQGISGHPNTLAKQVAVFMLLVIAARKRGHVQGVVWWGMLGLGVATLLATNSRTSLLAVLLAWTLVELRSRGLVLVAIGTGLVAAGLFVLAGSTGSMLDIDALLGSMSRSGDASEVLTLTGRTELWGFVWEKILERPLLGYGFNAFEPVVTKEWFGQEDASVGAHNTFLQALFTVGFVGTLPLVAAFGVLIYRWLTRPDALRDVVTAYLLVAGMTEVEISSIPVLLTLLAFLVIALDAARCRPGCAARRRSSSVRKGAAA